MSMGEFAYANHSNRFLAAAPLALQPQAPFVLAGVPYDGAVTNRPCPLRAGGHPPCQPDAVRWHPPRVQRVAAGLPG